MALNQNREPKGKEKIRQLQTELQNVSMAVRIMQVTMQQLLGSVQKNDMDVARSLEVANELQYRVLALLKLSGTDVAALDAAASEIKLNDYNEASDKEDSDKNYTVVNEALTENHVAIVTTKCLTAKEKSIFRAKFRIMDLTDPKVRELLVGAVIGSKVVINLNGLDHELEILGVRRLPAQEQPVAQLPEVAANLSETPAMPAQQASAT